MKIILEYYRSAVGRIKKWKESAARAISECKLKTFHADPTFRTPKPQPNQRISVKRESPLPIEAACHQARRCLSDPRKANSCCSG